MSFAHPSWSPVESTESPITFTLQRSNSGLIFAMYPSSVVQTGVKSLGCENSTAHESPIHSWKRILPSVLSASKSGAVSPSFSAMWFLLAGLDLSHHNVHAATIFAVRSLLGSSDVILRGDLMADEQLHDRIEKLVAEEHDLHSKVGEGGLSSTEHNRLESIKVSLDQCWDLLR